MSSVAASGPAIRSQRIRAIAASTVGTTIEWYDFFLYGTSAALVFPTVFFPGHTLYSGVLLSFGTQFVGLRRPADRGDDLRPLRRPDRPQDHADLHAAADGDRDLPHGPDARPTPPSARPRPILLVILRIAQGIGVGGEWGGSVLMSMEWGKQRWRGFMASWPQVGVPRGPAAVHRHGQADQRRGRIRLRHLGLAGAVPAQHRPGRHRALRAAARAGEPVVQRAQAPAGDRPPAGLAGHQGAAAGDPVLGVRPDVRAGAVLPVHHVRAHLRHRSPGARPRTRC